MRRRRERAKKVADLVAPRGHARTTLALLALGLGVIGAPGSAAEPSGSLYYVDGSLGSRCGSYSAAARNCSGRDGRAFTTLQAAAKALAPGDTVLIRDGVYALPARGEVVLSRSGTADRPIRFEGYRDERVIIRGIGFEDRDRNGDGFADGPRDRGDRSALIRITGDHVQVRRVEVEQAPHYGVLIQGGHNLLEEVRVRHSWMSNVVLSGVDNMLRYVEAHHSRHGSGIGIGPGKSGEPRRNVIHRCLSHDNGRETDDRQVRRIKGDPAGGGNSDGMQTSKECSDRRPEIVCRDVRFVENVVWRNVDDGFDLTMADSEVVANVSIDNGPAGRRGVKTLRPGPGNRFVGNVALGGTNQYRGFEPRGADTLDFFHNLALGSSEKGVYAITNGAGRGRYYNNVGYRNAGDVDFVWTGGEAAHNWAAREVGDPRLAAGSASIDFNLPEGSIAQRWRFLMDQVTAAFTLVAESPLVDAGRLVEGFHCPRADDDPAKPMDPDEPCRHWAGKAPDIGPFELGLPPLRGR
jgi:hypothetical protein